MCTFWDFLRGIGSCFQPEGDACWNCPYFQYCFQGGREIVRVTEAGGISLTDAQKLRGRMQFAEAQIYGRTGTRCLRALREVCCRKRTQFLDHEFLSLRLFANMLEMGKPRVITWDKRSPLVIFTDVCYERDACDLVCGVGAVLIDEHSGCRRFFSCSF